MTTENPAKTHEPAPREAEARDRVRRVLRTRRVIAATWCPSRGEALVSPNQPEGRAGGQRRPLTHCTRGDGRAVRAAVIAAPSASRSSWNEGGAAVRTATITSQPSPGSSSSSAARSRRRTRLRSTCPSALAGTDSAARDRVSVLSAHTVSGPTSRRVPSRRTRSTSVDPRREDHPRTRSGREARATFTSARPDDRPAGPRGHSVTESVAPLAASLVRLVCALHGILTRRGCVGREESSAARLVTGRARTRVETRCFPCLDGAVSLWYGLRVRASRD